MDTKYYQYDIHSIIVILICLLILWKDKNNVWIGSVLMVRSSLMASVLLVVLFLIFIRLNPIRRIGVSLSVRKVRFKIRNNGSVVVMRCLRKKCVLMVRFRMHWDASARSREHIIME